MTWPLVLAAIGILIVVALAAIGAIQVLQKLLEWIDERRTPHWVTCGYYESLDQIREALGYRQHHAHSDVAAEAVRRLAIVSHLPPIDDVARQIDAVLVERVRFARRLVKSETDHVVDGMDQGDAPGLIEAREHFLALRRGELTTAEALLQAWRSRSAAVDSSNPPADTVPGA